MSAPRQERLLTLFSRACDLARGEQARFLEHECANDPELARELAELLEEDRAGHEELERPAAEHLRTAGVAEMDRGRIGGNGVLRLPDAGGTGADHEIRSVDFRDLENALARLGEVDAGLARLVELRFLAGLSVDEIAAQRGVSRSRVEKDWRLARALLGVELGSRASGTGHP